MIGSKRTLDLTTRLLFSLALLALLFLAACTSGPAWTPPVASPEPAEPAVGLPNPASAYCGEQGGKLEIRADQQGNQHGVCMFADGTECEEWAFFRGECAPGGAEEPQSLTLASLQNATYTSEWTQDGAVALVDGEYRAPGAPGSAAELVVRLTEFVAFGDLDGDGMDEAAAVLVIDPGGSGVFYDLVVLVNKNGAPQQTASAPLGDRVRIKTLTIETGQIVVEMTTHGPDDPLCCPTQEVTRRYAWRGQTLNLVEQVIHPGPDTGSLITLVQSTLREEYNSYGRSGGLSVLPLTAPPGSPPLWAVYSYGGRTYVLEPAPGHLLAIFTWTDGQWQELDRISLSSRKSDAVSPEYVFENGVTQISLDPDWVWLAVQGGVGAHGGAYNLVSFDGQRLRVQLANAGPIPGAGGVPITSETGLPAILMDATDPYVFCYACGVRKVGYRFYAWDKVNQAFSEITLQPMPATQSGHPAQPLNDRAVVLAQAGLWQDALATITEAKAAAVTSPTSTDTTPLDWNYTLIKQNADGLAVNPDQAVYPLLEYIFYGDFDAAVDLMRAHPPEQLFTSDTPLIQGTVAEGWLNEVAGRVFEHATAALGAKPDLAPAYFLRGWAYYLDEATRDLAEADITQAAGLRPNDPLFGAAKTFFDFLSDAKSSWPEPVRIQFPAGATSLTLPGRLISGGTDQYVFNALAGQYALVSISAPDHNALLELKALAGDQPLANAAMGESGWQGTLPLSGDYSVGVVATDGPADYWLQVTIPVRVQFAPGAISAVVEGQLDAGETHDYILRAMAGQTMTVTIYSPNGAGTVGISGLQGGELLAGREARLTTWTGTLPGSQDYMIGVISAGDATPYTMEIVIQ